MNEQYEQYDVAVVGYGPVGQLLATLLGRAGHRVAVLERWPTFYPMPRAAHFDHEVARILQNIGLRPDQSTAIEPYDALYAWRNADREDLLLVDWSGVKPTGWHTSYFFSQPLLEPQLDALARQQPTVSVQRGWEVVAVEDEPGEPVVLVVEATDGVQRTGEQRTLTTRYVVGADGANSFVRSVIGTPLHDLGYFYDWLVVDVVLHGQHTFNPPAWQLCDPARPTTLVPGGPGRRRWEFMRLPHERIDDLNRIERAWELLDAWDVRHDNATIERHAVYTFQARWAQTWRRGRLMIAGDAAHLMPPFAGQGMCAGLRDAMNLSWKLDLVLRGKAAETVLDTYGSERTTHVRAFIDFSMELGRLICITDPNAAAERDARMLAERDDPSLAPPPPPPPRLGPGLAHDDDPAAGLMSIQAPVTTAAGRGLFDDVIGGGALILASPSVDLDERRRRALHDVGIAVVAIRPHTTTGTAAESPPVEGTVIDDTGAYSDWLAELAADAVLVRPDFAVHGTAPRGGDVTALVDGFLTALGNPATAATPLADTTA
ncbi:bifunctional 3-(3-hydroxy-phenyl)propionate/3-hydroxycinnamic acid hydroxylase MhpA [Pseudonocardia nigra]|uniref:bifunctional 3-(3-hydroxy-phenyl)propionate/3-hydroxycinnamic acid hydroxylase MhpA n=1 Tax=Pseudonocardia nigra TaxID=1921578 RepID=UPI001C5E16C4|nr:bifunctional 3-(3-hydroxy-phenyl)propionate/3-hydroxycinnamic acid hydroxylase [Pseudonocardia nigra]